MRPIHLGDTHDIAKLRVLNWLAPEETWFAHPMYFLKANEIRDAAFPDQYADFLGVNLVNENIECRHQLVDAVTQRPGNLFLDPDTGLRLTNTMPRRSVDNTPRKHLNVKELIAVAESPKRKRNLVLVYDHAISRDYTTKGTPVEQVTDKLCRIRDGNVHAVAYIAYHQRISFIWASKECDIVSEATRRIVEASRLPICCFVDDGCGHVPHP